MQITQNNKSSFLLSCWLLYNRKTRPSQLQYLLRFCNAKVNLRRPIIVSYYIFTLLYVTLLFFTLLYFISQNALNACCVSSWILYNSHTYTSVSPLPHIDAFWRLCSWRAIFSFVTMFSTLFNYCTFIFRDLTYFLLDVFKVVYCRNVNTDQYKTVC